MLFAFVQYDPMKALVVGLGYLVIGTALGNLAEPALMGHRLGLSPLVVFVSLVFWGWLWGAVGMFLSVPLTMTVKILLEHAPGWGWLAALLDSGPRAGAERPEVDGALAADAPGRGSAVAAGRPRAMPPLPPEPFRPDERWLRQAVGDLPVVVWTMAPTATSGCRKAPRSPVSG